MSSFHNQKKDFEQDTTKWNLDALINRTTNLQIDCAYLLVYFGEERG